MNRRPDAATLKAKRAEIRRRYARGKPKFSLAGRRVAELEQLFHARYRTTLPDDADGRACAEIMAHHLAGTSEDPRRSIPPWLEQWAPWLSIADAKAIMADAILRPRRWKADKLAWRLKLTDTDRERLGITTIGSIDVSRAERTQRREARKYQRLVMRRRLKGAKPRAQYEAQSISRAKPWESLGMSRASWYRAGKPA
jgi:hypothetical protein